MPEIPIFNKADTSLSILNDKFPDELYLAINQNDELSIITGCSHRGITNIVNSAAIHFNLPVNLILGGLHTKDCKTSQFETIINYFNHNLPKSIGVCHCTGIERYSDLLQRCKTKVFYNYTGNVIEI